MATVVAVVVVVVMEPAQRGAVQEGVHQQPEGGEDQDHHVGAPGRAGEDALDQPRDDEARRQGEGRRRTGRGEGLREHVHQAHAEDGDEHETVQHVQAHHRGAQQPPQQGAEEEGAGGEGEELHAHQGYRLLGAPVLASISDLVRAVLDVRSSSPPEEQEPEP
jgi:hypothetical protein